MVKFYIDLEGPMGLQNQQRLKEERIGMKKRHIRIIFGVNRPHTKMD